MIFMILFWASVLLNLLLYLLLKNSKLKNHATDTAIIISFLSLALLIVAIVTKDPIFAQLGVPPEFGWIVGLFITGFTSWKLYLDPLKERVIKVERKVDVLHSEVSSIKTDIEFIRTDTNLIKEKILSRK